MGLKATVKTLDEVDEKYRDLYVKSDDGTFRLDAEGIEDVSGLKKALERERELNKKKGDDGLSKAEKEELRELREAREKQTEADLAKEKDWKALEARQVAKFNKDLTAEQEKAQKATERLHRTLKENAATAAIAKLKGKVAPLLPHVIQNLDVVEENGEFNVVVKSKDGSVRYSKENPKDVMSVEDLVKTDFLGNEDFLGVFEGKGHSGSGAQGGGQGRNNGGTVTITKTDARNSQKYAAAKAEAIKAGQAAPVVVEG